MAEVEAYCVKCRKKRPLVGAQVVTMKNGKDAVRGSCPECGGAMFSVAARALSAVSDG